MDDNIIDLLRLLREKCSKTDEQILQELEITQATYHFCIASMSADNLEPAIMSEKMKISVSRLSRIIEKMVQENILERTPCKHDRRVNKISFTPKGEKIIDRIRAYKKSCEAKITDNLSPEMITQLRASILHLLETS